jgi:hypothetical protein
LIKNRAKYDLTSINFKDACAIFSLPSDTGESIPLSEAIGRYLVRAEPYLACTDPDYFVKEIDSILAAE